MTEMISIGGDDAPLQAKLAKNDADIKKRQQLLEATKRQVVEVEDKLKRIENQITQRFKGFAKNAGKAAIGAIILDQLTTQDEGSFVGRLGTSAASAFIFTGGGPQGAAAAALAVIAVSVSELIAQMKAVGERMRKLEDEAHNLEKGLNAQRDRVLEAADRIREDSAESIAAEAQRVSDETQEMIYQASRYVREAA